MKPNKTSGGFKSIIRAIKMLFNFYPVLVPVTALCILFSSLTSAMPAIFILQRKEVFWIFGKFPEKKGLLPDPATALFDVQFSREAGSWTRKVLQPPWLSAQILPLWAVTMASEMERPRP